MKYSISIYKFDNEYMQRVWNKENKMIRIDSNILGIGRIINESEDENKDILPKNKDIIKI